MMARLSNYVIVEQQAVIRFCGRKGFKISDADDLQQTLIIAYLDQ
jgi:hypothetical protein